MTPIAMPSTNPISEEDGALEGSPQESRGRAQPKIYVIEHLDPDLGPWSALEYRTIAQDSHRTGGSCCLTSVPEALELPAELRALPGLQVERQSVETVFAHVRDRVCLLDPAAGQELSPEDGDLFDVFLFGGILGA